MQYSRSAKSLRGVLQKSLIWFPHYLLLTELLHAIRAVQSMLWFGPKCGRVASVKLLRPWWNQAVSISVSQILKARTRRHLCPNWRNSSKHKRKARKMQKNKENDDATIFEITWFHVKHVCLCLFVNFIQNSATPFSLRAGLLIVCQACDGHIFWQLDVPWSCTTEPHHCTHAMRCHAMPNNQHLGSRTVHPPSNGGTRNVLDIRISHHVSIFFVLAYRIPHKQVWS